MNLPNILTVGRIFLTGLFILFMTKQGISAKLIAAFLFTLASISDYLDGYIAKTRGLVTDFGKIMDPIADKFLMLSAFCLFMMAGLFPLWMLVLIAAREIIVTALRLIAMRRGNVLAAEAAGKLKTVIQIVAVYLIMIAMIVNESGLGFISNRAWLTIYTIGIYVVMLVVVAITLVSGALFIYKNREKLC